MKQLYQKKVDERQEKELMKLGSQGFWFLYWILLASIFIQLFLGRSFSEIRGEWISFMCACVFMLIGCIRKGLWSFGHKKAPGMKYYVIYSLFGAVSFGIVFSLYRYLSYGRDVSLPALFLTWTAGLFVLLLPAFCIVGYLIRQSEKRRAKKLEEEMESEEEV